MKSHVISTLLLLAVTTSSIAQTSDDEVRLSARDQLFLKEYGPHFPVGVDPGADIPTKARLQIDPEDAWAIRKATDEAERKNEQTVHSVFERHFFFGLERVQTAMRAPLDDIEATLDEHEATLDALPGQSSAARAAIAQGREYLERERFMLEVYRTPRTQFRDRVTANPLSGMEVAKFYQRMNFDTLVLRETSPIGLRELISDANAVVEAIRRRTADIEKVDYSPSYLSPLKQQASLLREIEQSEREVMNAVEQTKSFVKAQGADFQFPVSTTWLNGSPTSAAEAAGKIAMVVLWSINSQKCGRVIPALQSIHADYVETDLVEAFCMTYYQGLRWDQAKNTVVLSNRNPKQPVTTQQEEDAINAYCKLHGLSLPFAVRTLKEFGQIRKDYGFTELPVVVIADQAGKIRRVQVWRSGFDTERIRETIEGLLQ